MSPFQVTVVGGGLAGQVLCRELFIRGVPARIEERAQFPREKVCGGVLQWDSWEYLNSVFSIDEPWTQFDFISHYWRSRKLSRIRMPAPMCVIQRFALDACLNLQQQPAFSSGRRELRVTATGAPNSAGHWIGFQGRSDPVDGLEMHYSKGFYLGRTPSPDGDSHSALIIRRELARGGGPEEVREAIFSELGVRLYGPLRGTPTLTYGPPSAHLAVGDAKLTTHPMLGLGMRHAILSSRLLAAAIAENRLDRFHEEHSRLTARWRGMSRFVEWLYNSPFTFAMRGFLGNERIFLAAFRSLHGRASELDKFQDTSTQPAPFV